MNIAGRLAALACAFGFAIVMFIASHGPGESIADFRGSVQAFFYVPTAFAITVAYISWSYVLKSERFSRRRVLGFGALAGVAIGMLVPLLWVVLMRLEWTWFAPGNQWPGILRSLGEGVEQVVADWMTYPGVLACAVLGLLFASLIPLRRTDGFADRPSVSGTVQAPANRRDETTGDLKDDGTEWMVIHGAI